jgi:hypothetical protein
MIFTPIALTVVDVLTSNGVNCSDFWTKIATSPQRGWTDPS